METFQNCIEEIGVSHSLVSMEASNNSCVQLFRNKMSNTFETCKLWPFNPDEYAEFLANYQKSVSENVNKTESEEYYQQEESSEDVDEEDNCTSYDENDDKRENEVKEINLKGHKIVTKFNSNKMILPQNKKFVKTKQVVMEKKQIKASGDSTVIKKSSIENKLSGRFSQPRVTSLSEIILKNESYKNCIISMIKGYVTESLTEKKTSETLHVSCSNDESRASGASKNDPGAATKSSKETIKKCLSESNRIWLTCFLFDTKV